MIPITDLAVQWRLAININEDYAVHSTDYLKTVTSNITDYRTQLQVCASCCFIHSAMTSTGRFFGDSGLDGIWMVSRRF